MVAHLDLLGRGESDSHLQKGGREIRDALVAGRQQATGPDTYVNFLKQFLPEFQKFLDDEGILENSYFHLSDEPGSGKHVENYKRARQGPARAGAVDEGDGCPERHQIRQAGPDRHSDSDGELGQGVHRREDSALGLLLLRPQGPWLNRFMDTPLPKIRMSGWLFYRLRGERGFCTGASTTGTRWKPREIGDPFHDASNGAWPGIPYGDPFMIYPGKDGPIDSIRWEVFAESLQDYAILQTAGIKPDDPDAGGVQNLRGFPQERGVDREDVGEDPAEVTKRPFVTRPSRPCEPRQHGLGARVTEKTYARLNAISRFRLDPRASLVPVLCDVLDSLGYRNQAMHQRLRPLDPENCTIVGPGEKRSNGSRQTRSTRKIHTVSRSTRSIHSKPATSSCIRRTRPARSRRGAS